jgi:FxsC-like protein
MTDNANKPSGGGPVFFLSYARPSAAELVQGDPDRDYAAFYYDLCSALTRFAPLDRLHSLGAVSSEWTAADRGSEDSGNGDSNGTHGSPDPDASKDIAECDVFIPLHQERYFQSEQCGRELAAFEARVRLAAAPRVPHTLPAPHTPRAARTPRSDDALLPVLWAPVSPQWAASQPSPYRTGHPDIDEEYLNRGLFWLQGAQPARYQHVVTSLARRVAELAGGRTVGRVEAADLAGLPSSLRQADRQPLAVVILAPAGDRPPGTAGAPYGRTATDWTPFTADTAAPLARVLVELARDKGWEPEVLSFGAADELLFGSGEPGSQVVLVVDPRALDDLRWRTALERLDGLDKPWIGVVVAWDPTGVPAAEQARLHGQLRRVLNRKFARRSPSLRVNAPIATSLQSFDLALDATANHTRIQLANHQLDPASHAAEEENH